MKYKLNELHATPFNRLEKLLSKTPINKECKLIDLSMGQPHHPMPQIMFDRLRECEDLWNLYPPVNATLEYRETATKWLNKRYNLVEGLVSPQYILPLSGTREGLFTIIQAIDAYMENQKSLVVGIPNPCFQTYQAAVAMCGGTILPLNAYEEDNFLPSLDLFTDEFCEKLSVLYVCTPTNPQGSFADYGYIEAMVKFAQKYNFVVVFDHCYSEIYNDEAPIGVLEIINDFNLSLRNIIVMHSLSKRSSAAGLRSGFVTGDPDIIQLYSKIRSYSCAGMPLPIVEASIALLKDENHVVENRNLYKEKFKIAGEIFADYPKFKNTKGGIFLWLRVNNSELMCEELWKNDSIKVLPGNFMTLDDENGDNIGKEYIRIAMIHDLPTMSEALLKIRLRIKNVENC